ncbi:hypothetical protein EXIGLDRAFT_729552 [Exidia glandulosa HHB12029]|uniref:Uncharacterized protein n=1 Tax=Exidia glandulosa HHB12029 TaxID=1314781 RepID=A0A165CIL8_EXIGL|nr:hypothetical protein EXIGLDRAFT_729552 [Exidia glandulosa HHB12029]
MPSCSCRTLCFSYWHICRPYCCHPGYIPRICIFGQCCCTRQPTATRRPPRDTGLATVQRACQGFARMLILALDCS